MRRRGVRSIFSIAGGSWGKSGDKLRPFLVVVLEMRWNHRRGECRVG